MNIEKAFDTANRIRSNIEKVVVGKKETIDLLLSALFGNGHVLLEDVPGTGKTLLAKTIARSIDGEFRRVQFTPDLLPSDLSGINFYNQKKGDFEFRPGPLFTHVLLGDEINRATPRTQSSLLECMEERQVTIDGMSHKLASPFFVLATQNPIDNQGTFPLPEAQLDRFLMRIAMGYPTFEEGVGILERFRENNPLDELRPVATEEEVAAAQHSAARIHVSQDLLAYIVRIIEATRKHNQVRLGASPRASGALLRASQGYALIQGREYVAPDDIKAVAIPVLAHRLVLHRGFNQEEAQDTAVIRQVLSEVEVPAEMEMELLSKESR
ncbi:ATPase family [compost metagenome]